MVLAFPFVGTTGAKRRPALVLLDAGDDDVVVARVTSQPRQSAPDVRISEWQQAGLLQPSVARLHKLATLEKRLVQRKLGELTLADWTNVKAELQKLWASP